MEILKYLDVLIGLAVVMVLLSPLVSAFTQVWMWLSNARSGRLQVGLANIILELNGNPFERFDTASISGLPPSAPVNFQQPRPQPPITTNADAAGNLVLTQNVPAMLAANGGNLLGALSLPAGAAPVIHLRPRGSGEDWQITSPATDVRGAATIGYRFTGPPPFAGYQATANAPAGATLTVTIGGGNFKGVQLNQAGGVFTYPAHIRPIPCAHNLVLNLTSGGAPLAGTEVTLTFRRNADFDQLNPLPGPAAFTADEAAQVAGAVLLHPMVAQPQFWKLPLRRKGEVVEREELIRLLLGFAANPAGSAPLEKLREILANNDVADPVRALADIRDAAQRLELTEDGLAAHERLTKAILMSAQSAFVGRINNWFDHAMDRTTAEYKFRAQLVTVLGALIVASVVQLDSIELLKRLSSDDKLRDSLVKQAEIQQKRLDDQSKAVPANQSQDEMENAKARRDEIEGDLAKLRDPQLAILPDHFVWQRLPRGRLMNNPKWQPPHSQRLELMVGGSAYLLKPQWSWDPLDNIEAAIRNSGAPVKTSRDKPRTVYTVTGPNVDKLRITADGSDRRLWHVASPGLTTTAAGGAEQYDDRLFRGAKRCKVAVGDTTKGATKDAASCTGGDVKAALEALGYRVEEDRSQHLLVTSQRLGPVQLRSVPGNPESNMLNSAEEWSSDWPVDIDWDLLSSTWRGVLLTWILLSLGAPFWYDALKDLLKLRSTLAKKEEDARLDRQTAGTGGKAPAKAGAGPGN